MVETVKSKQETIFFSVRLISDAEFIYDLIINYIYKIFVF